MRDLTVEEIDQVGGGINPIAGAAFSALSYGIVTLSTGTKPTLSGFAGALTLGAVTYGFGSLAGTMTGVSNIARQVHATAIGSLSGACASNIVTGNGGGEGEASTLHRLEK